MENTFTISCEISNSDVSVPLGMEIWINNNKIFDQDWIKETVPFSYKFTEEDGDYELKFVMKNKTIEHTKTDQDGNIVKDAVLSVTKIYFDDIELDKIISQTAIYTHDFNGTKEQTQMNFHKDLGCNGTVSMKFSTPIYIWLLENM